MANIDPAGAESDRYRDQHGVDDTSVGILVRRSVQQDRAAPEPFANASAARDADDRTIRHECARISDEDASLAEPLHFRRRLQCQINDHHFLRR